MINKEIYTTDNEFLKIFNDQSKITRVIQEGIQIELKKHKQAGNAICEWKNNKVHWIPAEQI